MTPETIHAGLSFIGICIGVGLCVLVFMACAAMGHIWSVNARPEDEYIPRPWLHREDGE